MKKRVETLIELWKSQGLAIGGVVIEGDRIAILSVESAANENDVFESWERSRRNP
jgi:hypothetical protein